MKKILSISMLLISVIVFSQIKPKLENIEDKVQATYFYENGNIQQVGNFVDGKLEGKWISYSEDGNIQVIAQFKNGKKQGKWQYFDTTFITKEVEYKNDGIVQVITINKNPIAYDN